MRNQSQHQGNGAPKSMQGGDVLCTFSDSRDALSVVRSSAQALLCGSCRNGPHTSEDLYTVQVTRCMHPLMTVEYSSHSQAMHQEGLAQLPGSKWQLHPTGLRTLGCYDPTGHRTLGSAMLAAQRLRLRPRCMTLCTHYHGMQIRMATMTVLISSSYQDHHHRHADAYQKGFQGPQSRHAEKI